MVYFPLFFSSSILTDDSGYTFFFRSMTSTPVQSTICLEFSSFCSVKEFSYVGFFVMQWDIPHPGTI